MSEHEDESPEATTMSLDSGMVLACREADGGFILEVNAPREGFRKRSIVAGEFESANTKKAVVRKFRRMIAEWADLYFPA